MACIGGTFTCTAMPTENLNFFDLSYASTDDPDGFSDNGGYQFTWGVSTITIAPGATETLVSVDDVDSSFDDDQDANQTLNGPATLNGTSYPDGTWIQSEYGVVVEDSLGNTYNLQFVSAGTDAYNIVGFVVQGPVPPFGEALTVVSTSDGHSGSYAYATSSPACFGRKSRIATTRGHILAKDLRRGDQLCLADGTTAMVELVLSSTASSTRKEGLPIRIRKDAFGPALPKRDLILSGQHRVWVPALGALVPAKALVGLPRIGRVRSAVGEELIHIVLRSHDVLLAEGLPCESFWPGRTALALLPPDARRQVRRIMGRAEPALPFMSVQDAIRNLEDLARDARSASPVRGIPEGGEEERDVVMGIGIGHPEPQRHHIEEKRLLNRLPRRAEVIPRIENKLIDPDLEVLLRQDRAVGASVVIGDHGDDPGQPVPCHPEKRDGQTGGGLPRRGIKHMCGEISPGHSRSIPNSDNAGSVRPPLSPQQSTARPVPAIRSADPTGPNPGTGDPATDCPRLRQNHGPNRRLAGQDGR